MRCRHWYYFGEYSSKVLKGKKLNKDNWNILRNADMDKNFSIEETVEEYDKNCRLEESYRNVAEILCDEFDRKKSYNIASVGVGKGILEWHIKNMRPDIKVTCTDYTEEALKKLKKVFRKADALLCFDMLKDDWSMLNQYDYVILYRVSTEFSFSEWKKIFEQMSEKQIEHVVFIPTGLDTYKNMLLELSGHLVRIMRKKKDIFCGWLYSENEFRRMWKGKYVEERCIYIQNTAVFFLNRIK